MTFLVFLRIQISYPSVLQDAIAENKYDEEIMQFNLYMLAKTGLSSHEDKPRSDRHNLI